MSGNKILPAFAVLAVVLLIMLQMRTSNRVKALETERNSLAEIVTAQGSHLEQLQSALVAANSNWPDHAQALSNPSSVNQARLPAQAESSSPGRTLPNALPANQAMQQRLAALEERLQKLTNAASTRPGALFVPEYNPFQPPVETNLPDWNVVPSTRTNSVPKRSWGQEQILGPPDTHQAGDIPTAWASLAPDAGPEWLWVDFDKQSQLAEVRIRETYNPGAISKVTAVVGGQEVVLWEGTAKTGPAPRDFVVPVDQNISAQSIVVHMDTTRVPGWNEIDAIELVARDGSRQWATGANASTTYAERPPTPQQPVDTVRTNSMNLR